MTKLLLIDGNSLTYRAYFATIHGRAMTTKNGIPTNALYGFVQMINAAINKFNPDEILVAFDTGKKTFRHEQYSQYKANRKPPDPSLIAQFPLVREYLDARNINHYEFEGIEGDDIIGSMAKASTDKEVYILSGDHDLFQLIDKNIYVALTKTGLSDIDIIDIEALKNDYHITPCQVKDMKGLMGDTADNIPGVPGVGDKTALALISEYGSLENVLDNVDKLKGKLKEKIETNRELAILSKQLATINTSFKIDYNGTLDYPLDKDKLYEFYKKYELNKFIAELDYSISDKKEETKEITKEYLDCFKPELFQKRTALFIVNSAEIHSEGEFKGIGLYNGQNGYFLPEDKCDDSFIDWLKGDSEKITYDIKEMYHLFPEIEINNIFDLMIGSFLVDDSTVGFKALTATYQGFSKLNVDAVYGKPNKPIFPEESNELDFSCQNAYGLYNCYEEILDKLEEMNLKSLYYDVEFPLAKVLYSMEKEGIRIDKEALEVLEKETLLKINQLSLDIYKDAGEEFNINSPKKLSEILYDKLGLKGDKKRSTSVEILEKLKNDHPIIEKIMEYRKYQKFYSTYALGLQKYIKDDGKIHTSYNQCIVSTGRLSSTEPNLQNISVRDQESKEIRKAFIPETDCVLMSADYSQVELRILAHMANEESLMDAFRKGIDAHTKTAMDIFKVNKEDVSEVMRRKAKMINFGIVYGISDFGLAERLGISRYEAKDFIDQYYKTYQNIRLFLDQQVEFCQKNGYVTTLLNRRRNIPEINDKNYMVKEFGKRAAMNAPIQGTAADLIKLAMINIFKMMEDKKLKSRMILQVHDELIFNVYNDEFEIMKEIIETGMENAMKLNVPLEAECVYGNTWYEAK